MADNIDDLLTMQNKTYTTFAEFKSDIKKFTKYCRERFPEHEPLVKALNKVVTADLKHINLCSQCYENQANYPNPVCLLCDPLHLLIWAKTKGFNYWPAKLVKLQGTSAHVIYFGEYTNAKVATADCLIYSKDRPDKLTKIANYNLFDESLREAEMYANNIKNKYGHFNYAKGMVRLGSKSLMEHISDMTTPIGIDKTLSKPDLPNIDHHTENFENKSNQMTAQSNEASDATTKSTLTIPANENNQQIILSETPQNQSIADSLIANNISQTQTKTLLNDAEEPTQLHNFTKHMKRNQSLSGMSEDFCPKRLRFSDTNDYNETDSPNENDEEEEDDPISSLDAIATNANNIIRLRNTLKFAIRTKDEKIFQLEQTLSKANDMIQSLKTENSSLKEETLRKKSCLGCGVEIAERKYCDIQCVEQFYR